MNSILKIDDLKKVNFEKIDINKYQQNDLKPSSVFILIFETIKGKEILFLKRSNTLEFHKGEICFPGGSFDLSDKHLLNTAYREVEEETGIKKKDIELKFSLNEQITRTRFSIKPFVGVIKKEVKINLDKIDRNLLDLILLLPRNSNLFTKTVMSSLIVDGSLTGFVACPHLFDNELSVGILEIISPALG